MLGADEIIVLSPGLSQSFAIADMLARHRPGCRLLGYPLPGEKDGLRPPFARYVGANEGEPAVHSGAAIMTGSEATIHVLQHRASVRLGEVAFERRNLWFYDKIATLDRARQLDIPVPSTWTSADDIADREGPIFYKPAREGMGGARKKVPSVRAVPPAVRRGGYLLQEVIEGPSVIGFGFVADRGRVVASSLHHEMFSFPRDGGSAVAVESCECPRVEELAKRLICEFQYSGWGLIEFKPCPRRNDFVFMELNAKFWASIEFTLRTCPLFAHLLFGIRAEAEPIKRMIWPSRLLRNGLLHVPASLRKALPAGLSRERLHWHDGARSLFPGR